jgi:hypothetical protein
MEIAVAAAAAHDHDILMDYITVLLAIPFGITCIIVMSVAIILFIMLWFGFFSVILLVLNAQICVLTGVEPGTGMDGMYVIADIIAISLIVCSIYFRPPDVERDAHEDEDEDDE